MYFDMTFEYFNVFVILYWTQNNALFFGIDVIKEKLTSRNIKTVNDIRAKNEGTDDKWTVYFRLNIFQHSIFSKHKL